MSPLAEAVTALLATFDAELVEPAGQEDVATAAYLAMVRHEPAIRTALADEVAARP